MKTLLVGKLLLSFVYCLHIGVSSTTAQGIQTTPSTIPTCPELSLQLSGGHVNTNSFHNGHVIYYFCDWGYILWGAESLHCGIDGQWSDQPPVCAASVGCTTLPMLENGYTYYHVKGGAATFECNNGYALTGSAAVYCDGTKWNATIPLCQPKNEFITVLPVSNCPHPIKAADVTREIFDEVVVYTCMNGSSPTLGSERLECGLQGQWKSDAVICARIGCVIPEPPANGLIIRKFSNAVLEFRCYANYEIQGPSIVYCNGVNWNGTTPTVTPTCVPIGTAVRDAKSILRGLVVGGTRCNNAPMVDHSVVEYLRLKDSRGVLYWGAHYVCREGYRKTQGSFDVYCSEGNWVGAPPVCIRNNGAQRRKRNSPLLHST